MQTTFKFTKHTRVKRTMGERLATHSGYETAFEFRTYTHMCSKCISDIIIASVAYQRSCSGDVGDLRPNLSFIGLAVLLEKGEPLGMVARLRETRVGESNMASLLIFKRYPVA